MPPSSVVVEEVVGGKELTRFVELPQVLHGHERAFAAPVMAWERYRVDHRRNPYLEWEEPGLFLARRLGRIVGRIAAHRSHGSGEGRFGFWTLLDDPEVAAALIEAARAWLTDRGCTSMRGPLSFEDDDEPGLLVAGFESPGCTGRPWHPPHAARLLEALGPAVVEEHATWRLAAEVHGGAARLGGPTPGQAAGYVDPRLVFDDIAAVPDVAPALASTALRHAWALARRARLGDWEDAVVVRCSGDPAVSVPTLLAAAAAAGYRSVVSPWAPDPSLEPETRHRRYRFSW
jgi:hypothetical protein